jgi:hypothetical protein
MKTLTYALAAVALIAVSAAAPAAPAPKARMPSGACAAMKTHMSEKPAAPAAGADRPLSADSKAVLGSIAAMGDKSGSAAPNAQAQAMLDMMASLFAGRGDAESQASARLMRQMGAKPGSNIAGDMAALGC